MKYIMARQEINIFGTSFLDLLSGALAAVIILFIIIPKMTKEDVELLEKVKEIQEIIVEKCNLGERHKIIPYKGKDQRIGTLMFSGGRQCEIIREWLYYDSHICLERKSAIEISRFESCYRRGLFQYY